MKDGKIQSLERDLVDSKDRAAELEVKVKTFEEFIDEVNRRNPDSIEAKLATNTKRMAMMDVNLIKLARKYDCLNEEYKTLQSSYKRIEAEFTEKEQDLLEKLYRTIEWKRRAQQQMRILLTAQQKSISLEE